MTETSLAAADAPVVPNGDDLTRSSPPSPFAADAAAPRPPELAPRLAATAGIEDPALRPLVEANVRLQTQREIRDFTRQQRDLKAQAKAIIDQGGDLGSIPAKLLLQIDAGGRKALQDYVAAHANPRTDAATYYALKDQALGDPASFTARDLSDHMAGLDAGHYAELQQLQASLASGQPPADFPLQQVYRANTDRLFQQLGLNAATGTPQAAQQALHLRQVVDQRLAAQQVIQGRPATPAEQQQILDQAVIDHVINSPSSPHRVMSASASLPQAAPANDDQPTGSSPGSAPGNGPGNTVGNATQLAMDDTSSATTPPAPQKPAGDGAAPQSSAAADEAGDWKAAAWPVPGNVTLNQADPDRDQGDGRFHSRNGEHQGIDIHAPLGAPVVAASDGVILRADNGDKGGYGYQIVIDHGNGIYTQYGHLNAQMSKDAKGKTVMTFSGPDGKILQLKVGQKVTAGEQIGIIGKTGNVPKHADSHLHFEVRHGSPLAATMGGHVVDPLLHLPQ